MNNKNRLDYKQIIKKRFLFLHKTKALLLIQSINNISLNDTLKAIDNIPYNLKTYPVLKVDVKNDKISFTTIYKYKKFFIVDTIINNLKNCNCSWNNKTTNSIIYKLK
jgi:hypothetical protein